jgi:Xaa-Pro aminopeptidase
MTAANPHAARREELLRPMKGAGVDGLLVSNRRNVFYLSGFRGEDSMLILRRGRPQLLTDGRFSEQAEQETRGIEIVVRKKGMMPTAGLAARRAGIKTLGVEAESLTVAQAEDLKAALGKVALKPVRALVQRQRMVKDAAEVRIIRRAVAITQQAFLDTLKHLRAGMTELEVAHILDRTMVELGAEGPAFETIVAAGERGSLPHARPTERRIRSGEAVLFDWGARLEGYCADLTRLAFIDRIPPVYRRIYPLVLTAQRRAVARVRAGRKTGELDAIARGYLKAHRHGKDFRHSLGHGLGLDVHEGPSLARGTQTPLRAGMVVTVEPGIYLPGRAGVRIEDLLLVTRKGHESLTSLPRSIDAFLVRS